MSLKAKSLTINPIKHQMIDKEVKIILSRIDDEIKSAYNQDESFVNVSVPIIYTIPHLSNKSAQRIIYFQILQSLMAREYDVKIQLTPEKTVFIIRWVSDDDANDISLQNTLLAKHTLK